MSASFTQRVVLVDYLSGAPMSWSYLADYLHFVITGLTIVVVAVPEGLPLVRPGAYCSPRHPTHFDPSFHELNGIL
jgi:hypothetical protein